MTVSGASPVVDVANVRTQNVLSRQNLDALPTGKSVPGYAALTLGATQFCVRFGRQQRRIDHQLCHPRRPRTMTSGCRWTACCTTPPWARPADQTAST